MCEATVPLLGKATTRRVQGPRTHSNERKGAARVDCDATGLIKLCVGADVVVLEALHAAAGDGGGRSGADVDTADAVISLVLRCIGREHTLSEEQTGSAVFGDGHHALEGGGAGLLGACVRGETVPLQGKATRRGVQGARHAQQRAQRCRSGRYRWHWGT